MRHTRIATPRSFWTHSLRHSICFDCFLFCLPAAEYGIAPEALSLLDYALITLLIDCVLRCFDFPTYQFRRQMNPMCTLYPLDSSSLFVDIYS
jgi:hypothetical protein